MLKCDLRLNLKVRGFPLRWFRIDMANEYLIEIDFFLCFFSISIYFKSYMCVCMPCNVIQNILLPSRCDASDWDFQILFSLNIYWIFTEIILIYFHAMLKIHFSIHKFYFILKLFTSWFRFTRFCRSVGRGMWTSLCRFLFQAE